MNIQELKLKSSEQLITQAEELGIENASTLRKQEILFTIIKKVAEKEEILKKINNLENFKLIFSAHGLPEKNIKKGDPYQWKVEQ